MVGGNSCLNTHYEKQGNDVQLPVLPLQTINQDDVPFQIEHPQPDAFPFEEPNDTRMLMQTSTELWTVQEPLD
jgi:hypothetical protein